MQIRVNLHILRAATLKSFSGVARIWKLSALISIADRLIETYNNAYFDITKWNDCAAQLHLDNSPSKLRSSFFSEALPSGASAATRIFTVYSADDYNYWQYDPASGRYLRYEETDDTAITT